MIEVINYTNKETEQSFESVVEKSYLEVRQHLWNIPESIDIYFAKDDMIVPETGVGGFAFNRHTITLSVEKDFPDKELQAADVRGTVFHESFHVAQHFTAEDGYHNAIHSAIYEGCATVFERDYAHSSPLHANYAAHSEEELQSWLKRLEEVGASCFEEDGVWEEWAFYNEELKQRWIVYKTGTWLVDQILQKTGLTVLDFQDKTAEEIYALYTI